jgi:hypothetical protein
MLKEDDEEWKLNLPNTKFHWNLFSCFRAETRGQSDMHSLTDMRMRARWLPEGHTSNVCAEECSRLNHICWRICCKRWEFMDISGNTRENSCQSDQAENREHCGSVLGALLPSSPRGCTWMSQWTEFMLYYCILLPPVSTSSKAPTLVEGFNTVTNICVNKW